jgi:antitoxin MazE
MNSHEVCVKTRIRKWGNSLGLRIPRSFANEAGVDDGSMVDISVQNGDLLIRPVRRARYSLAELLADVNEGNLHGEVSTGDPVGSEDW